MCFEIPAEAYNTPGNSGSGMNSYTYVVYDNIVNGIQATLNAGKVAYVLLTGATTGYSSTYKQSCIDTVDYIINTGGSQFRNNPNIVIVLSAYSGNQFLHANGASGAFSSLKTMRDSGNY